MNSSPTTTTPSSPSANTNKIVGLSFLAILVFAHAFVAWGFIGYVGDALRQHRILSTSVEVPATILDSRIDSYKPDKGSMRYRPVIRFQYEAAGKTNQSDKVLLLDNWGGQEWADDMISRFQTGSNYPAYYDPRAPSQAFLLKRYDFEPYFRMLMTAFTLTLASYIFVSFRKLFDNTPVPAGNGRFELNPFLGLKTKLHAAALSTGVCFALGAIPAIHYFLYFPPTHSRLPLKFFLGYALLGLIPIGLLLRSLQKNRSLQDAKVLIDRADVTPGVPFHFNLSHVATRDTTFKNYKVSLACLKGRDYTVTEIPGPSVNERTLRTGESIDLSGEFTLHPDPASLDEDGLSKNARFFIWKMLVTAEVQGAPDYNATFPLASVRAAPLDKTQQPQLQS